MPDLSAEGTRIAGALQAALAEPDALVRYWALTAVQGDVDALVSAIKLVRGAALDELLVGRTYEQVAELADLGSYQKAQKLVNAARAAQREEQQ